MPSRNSLLRSLYRFLLFFALAPCPSSALPIGSLICLTTKLTVDAQTAANTVRTYRIAVANGQLRHFNNVVLGNWKEGSEMLTNMLHFLFQFHLDETLKHTHGPTVGKGDAPWVKELLYAFPASSEDLATIADAAYSAKENAVDDLAKFIFDDDAIVRALITSVTGPDSTLSRTGKYVFSENRTYLEVQTAEDRDRLIALVHLYFRSATVFRSRVFENYGVGIGLETFDADFASRLTMRDSQTYGPVAIFDFNILRSVLQDLEKYRKTLTWLFDNRSETNLRQDFAVIRQNLDHDRLEDISPDLFKLLANNFPGTTPINQLQEFFKVQEYFGLLDLLRYHSSEILRVSSEARMQFENLKNPTGLLFLDARGIGAMGYYSVHTKVPEMLALVREIDALLAELEKNPRLMDDLAFQARLTTPYKKLKTLRENALGEAPDYLASLVNEVREALAEIGLTPDMYALWVSGDDLFVNLRTDIETQEIALRIKKRVRLFTGLRAGYLNFSVVRPGSVSLAFASATVGTLADPLKKVEGLHLGYEVVAELLLSAEPSVKLHVLDSPSASPANLPARHTRVIGAGLPGWKIQ